MFIELLRRYAPQLFDADVCRRIERASEHTFVGGKTEALAELRASGRETFAKFRIKGDSVALENRASAVVLWDSGRAQRGINARRDFVLIARTVPGAESISLYLIVHGEIDGLEINPDHENESTGTIGIAGWALATDNAILETGRFLTERETDEPFAFISRAFQELCSARLRSAVT